MKYDLKIDNKLISFTLEEKNENYQIVLDQKNYEADLIRERVVSGLENWKRKNPDKKLGRPSNLTPEIEDKILEMRSRKHGINKIAKACGVGTQAIYKIINADQSVLTL